MRYSRGMLSVVSSSTITYTNLRPTRGRATRVYQGGVSRACIREGLAVFSFRELMRHKLYVPSRRHQCVKIYVVCIYILH